MVQYCRYCSYMCCGDANWCHKKQKTMSDNAIKRINNCKDFDFNPEDALLINEKGYKSREKKEENKNQLKLELEE